VWGDDVSLDVLMDFGFLLVSDVWCLALMGKEYMSRACFMSNFLNIYTLISSAWALAFSEVDLLVRTWLLLALIQ
jgi:hypothetical protein